MQHRGATRLVAILVAVLWLVAPARAATLAVLPLDEGSGSAEHEGLGRAVAGMLVADLSGVERLTLVERARLEALLSEIELSESGYVDEATAQRLGKGVGAEWVLLGSWSQVGDTFALDARVVSTEQGTVVAAAKADGPVDDFVSVEKSLVMDLLEGLEVALSSSEQRAIWSEAPTEDFEAFTAWGEGLSAEVEGQLEEAEAAYRRALEADPSFEQARASLASLRTALEEARSDAAAVAGSAQQAAVERILAETVDERTHPAGFEHDNASRAAFAVRLMALENAGRSCQRYEEMLAFGEHTDWQVALPRGARSLAGERAETWGLERVPHDLPAPEAAKDAPRRRLETFEGLDAYVHDDEWPSRVTEGSGLLASLYRCQPGAERVEAIDGLIEALQRAGRGDADDYSPWGIARWLAVHAAWQQAAQVGPGPDLERRVDALLALDLPPDQASQLRQRVDDILREASRKEAYDRRTHGRSPEQLARFVRGMADRDPGVVHDTEPFCSTFLDLSRSQAREWVARWPTIQDEPLIRRQMIERAGSMLAQFASMGCVAGVEGRWSDVAGLRAHLEVAVDPAAAAGQPLCSAGLAMVQSGRSRSDTTGAVWAWTVLQGYWGQLVFHGCVQDRIAAD